MDCHLVAKNLTYFAPNTAMMILKKGITILKRGKCVPIVYWEKGKGGLARGEMGKERGKIIV